MTTQQPPGSGPGPGYLPVPEPTAGGSAGTPADRPAAGAARVLALVAAALGLFIYALGFVGEVSVTSSFGGPLLLAGGLLAGVAGLPRIGRVLAPAAVVTSTGTLLLVQVAVALRWPTVLVAAVALAGVQTAAAIGALLLDVGLVGPPDRRPGLVQPADLRGLPGPVGAGPGDVRSGGYARPGYGWPGGHAAPYAGPPVAAIGAVPAPGPGMPPPAERPGDGTEPPESGAGSGFGPPGSDRGTGSSGDRGLPGGSELFGDAPPGGSAWSGGRAPSGGSGSSGDPHPAGPGPPVTGAEGPRHRATEPAPTRADGPHPDPNPDR